jgi:hypothetical protein
MTLFEIHRLARLEGFEPPAHGLEVRSSIHLSYRRLANKNTTSLSFRQDENRQSNCLIKNVTERVIKKGSLTHNGCYRITDPKRRVEHESTVKKRIYRSHLFTL